MTDPAVYRIKGQSYSCILVEEGPKQVKFIPMSTLELTTMDAREFFTEWEAYAVYPVKRAAESYLGAALFRPLSSKVREHLEKITATKSLDYDVARITQPTVKEPIVAKATTAAKTPATSKLGKTDSAKPAPAKTKVGAATKPAAAPAKKVADKPAKNGINTVVEQTKAAKPAAKTAAPAKQPANKPAAKTAAPAKTVGRPSANADQKLKVAEPDKPRRGVTQEYVTEAIKLKTFTRQQLHDIMVGKGHESGAARTKIADCVYFQVFIPA